MRLATLPERLKRLRGPNVGGPMAMLFMLGRRVKRSRFDRCVGAARVPILFCKHGNESKKTFFFCMGFSAL